MSKFLLGLAVGVALGIVVAPAKGELTRQRIADKAEEFADLPRKKAARFMDATKEKAAQAAADIARKATESAVEAAKEDLLGNGKTA